MLKHFSEHVLCILGVVSCSYLIKPVIRRLYHLSIFGLQVNRCMLLVLACIMASDKCLYLMIFGLIMCNAFCGFRWGIYLLASLFLRNKSTNFVCIERTSVQYVYTSVHIRTFRLCCVCDCWVFSYGEYLFVCCICLRVCLCMSKFAWCSYSYVCEYVVCFWHNRNALVDVFTFHNMSTTFASFSFLTQQPTLKTKLVRNVWS